MSESLEELLERLGQGDESAAAQLIATYEPFLRLVVRRYLPDRARAKFDSLDVVQSVWVHVLDGLRSGAWQFPDRAHLKAFLVSVARRRLISRCRHHHRALEREQRGLTDLDALPARPQPRPSEVVQADELWERMLALCPATHHELLRLRRQGLPLDEIARRTGLHEGSVRRILRRLARQLTLDQEPLACADPS
jgi:RNA polymerase sigma-70 factor (ECF subfamily)